MASNEAAATNASSYYEVCDAFGHLTKVSKRFGKMREVALRKYDQGRIWVFINDNSKCWNSDTKSFNIRETKTVSMAYEDAVQLIDILTDMETYKQRMDGETMLDDAQVHPNQPMTQGDVQRGSPGQSTQAQTTRPVQPTYQRAGMSARKFPRRN